MIYDSLKGIVDNNIANLSNYFTEIKTDNSLVTSVDLSIEKEISEYFKNISPNIMIIGEESYDGSLTWDLADKDYLIIDPIDGTENFAFSQKLYGTAISWRIEGNEGHLIYIPSENLFISDKNCNGFKSKHSTIQLFSSKCLNKMAFSVPENVRILGSSSYMFSLILTGCADSYIYCEGAKVWDCFTGLKLAAIMGLNIKEVPIDFFKTPTYKQKFKVSWT